MRTLVPGGHFAGMRVRAHAGTVRRREFVLTICSGLKFSLTQTLRSNQINGTNGQFLDFFAVGTLRHCPQRERARHHQQEQRERTHFLAHKSFSSLKFQFEKRGDESKRTKKVLNAKG